jgi:elongation factor P
MQTFALPVQRALSIRLGLPVRSLSSGRTSLQWLELFGHRVPSFPTAEGLCVRRTLQRRWLTQYRHYTHNRRTTTLKPFHPRSISPYTGKKLGSGRYALVYRPPLEDFMAALIDAINVKRKTLFELENTPFCCLEAEVNTPTARGGQTLVRLKMRNLLTNAVFEKTFKASDKFKEPDLQSVQASYLYSDSDGSHFLDQESYETVSLNGQMVGDALDFLIEGALIELRKYNGNPIGLELPIFVELDVAYTEPAVRGDSSGGGTKTARLETGLEIRVPLFIKEGEKVKVSTENREFAGRA